MPCIRMNSQRGIAIVQAACIKECKNSREKSEIHKKSKENSADFFRRNGGQKQADIHGDTAELERKVPPIILSAAQRVSKTPLLPDFA